MYVCFVLVFFDCRETMSILMTTFFTIATSMVWRKLFLASLRVFFLMKHPIQLMKQWYNRQWPFYLLSLLIAFKISSWFLFNYDEFRSIMDLLIPLMLDTAMPKDWLMFKTMLIMNSMVVISPQSFPPISLDPMTALTWRYLFKQTFSALVIRSKT